MAAISSVQRIGWPVSASTLAAASRALRRWLAASVGGAFRALAVLVDGGGFFFAVVMMLLLGCSNPEAVSRLLRCPLRTGQLPHRPASDQGHTEQILGFFRMLAFSPCRHPACGSRTRRCPRCRKRPDRASVD